MRTTAAVTLSVATLASALAGAHWASAAPSSTCPSGCINAGVGSAGSCTVLEVDGGRVDVTGPAGGIDGDVCIGPAGTLSITGSQFVTGDIRLAPGATVNQSGPGSIGVVLQNEDLSAEINDAITAATAAAALPCTQTFESWNGSQVIIGEGGLNVICVGDVTLNGGQVVTLSGGAGDTFVVNVAGRFALTGGSGIVASGVPPSAILYNIIGDGQHVALSGGGGGTNCCRTSIDGTVVALGRAIALAPGLVNGEVIGGQNISIVAGASVRCQPCPTTTTTSTSTTTTRAPTTTTAPVTTSTTVTATTTTSTTLAAIRCCLRSSPMGAFNTCMLLTATQCSASGINIGPGSCSPNPCPPSTTTTVPTTTTTTAHATTSTTVTTTTTTSTTLTSIRCCVRSSPMGAFNSCMLLTATQCSASGINIGPGSCSPNPCPPSTTTTVPATTTTTTAHATTSTTATTTTTTGTTAHATTSTVTTTTTTSTTVAAIRCCLRSSPMGAFNSCMLLTATQCSAQSGINLGAGSCSPNPCPPSIAGLTFLASPANAGATTLDVVSTTGFTIGDTIRINPGGVNQEDHTISGFGSIILSQPLSFDHGTGESVTKLTTSTTTTTRPPTTTTSSTTSTTTRPPTTTTSSTTSTTTRPPTTTTSSTTSTTTRPPTTTTSSTTTTTTGPATTSSTTTSSTTSTTAPPNTFGFTTVLGTSNCGGPGLMPAASSPFSGQLFSDTAMTSPISGGELGLGCLYIGGGNAITVPPDRIPDSGTTYLARSGGTLSASAGTGNATCSLGQSTTSSHCIAAKCTLNATKFCTSNSNCGPSDGTCPFGNACTADGQCDASRPGTCAPDANCFFGPPLPIPNFGLSTCVLNVIKNDASGTFNAVTGDAAISLHLVSRVYLTGNGTAPCPRCVSGTCERGQRQGLSCTTVTSVGTSLDCPPQPSQYLAPLDVDLTPLTTSAAAETAPDGNFCPGQVNPGAFGITNAQALRERGSPGGMLSDMGAHTTILGSAFCIPATGNTAIDVSADLPGPGAIGLNASVQLH